MKRINEFRERLSSLKSELGHASLLIVSKGRSIDEIKTYYSLGHRDFGENRVQELAEKSLVLEEVCPDIRWHMIGHLQSNKLNNLLKIKNLYAIHSLDSSELVQKISAIEGRTIGKIRLFLQVNTSKEVEKSGFENLDELKESGRTIMMSKSYILYGLMTMGTVRTTDFEAEARRCFKELNGIKEGLEKDLHVNLKTSMGMTQDYKIALEEKSDWIRIGTRMFV